MPSYGNGKLRVKTLGDLRKLVKKLEDLEDDYEVVIEETVQFSLAEYTLTDNIDVSYSNRVVSINLDVE